VITTWDSPMARTAAASSAGSDGSSGRGRPWAMEQYAQFLVHTRPLIRKVAVPRPKHSERLGQRASSQTVCSPPSRIRRLIPCSSPSFSLRPRIHGGSAGAPTRPPKLMAPPPRRPGIPRPVSAASPDRPRAGPGTVQPAACREDSRPPHAP